MGVQTERLKSALKSRPDRRAVCPQLTAPRRSLRESTRLFLASAEPGQLKPGGAPPLADFFSPPWHGLLRMAG